MRQFTKFITSEGTLGIKIKYFDEAYQKEREIQLCSRYAPLKQAEIWAKEIYKKEVEKFVIYGIGVGHHIRVLQALLHEGQELVVLETNAELFTVLDEEGIVDKIENYGKTEVILMRSIEELGEQLVSNKKISFGIYQPSLQIIPKHMSKLREVLENYQVRVWNTERLKDMLGVNIAYHQTKVYENVSKRYGSAKGKPVVIVSAGPSLSESLEDLKQIENEVFILATGRVFKALLKHHIRVDMFCIIDAHAITYSQIEEVEDSNVPFVFLNTVCQRTVEGYRGPKYIAYNMDSPLEQEGRLESGGSVATACIDLAIKLGGNPIILIGQDLAYTDNTSHSKECEASQVKYIENMRKVKGNDGVYYPTTEQLLSFKGWIEQKIRITPEVDFINATQKGAYIEGCKHISLQEWTKSYKNK